MSRSFSFFFPFSTKLRHLSKIKSYSVVIDRINIIIDKYFIQSIKIDRSLTDVRVRPILWKATSRVSIMPRQHLQVYFKVHRRKTQEIIILRGSFTILEELSEKVRVLLPNHYRIPWNRLIMRRKFYCPSALFNGVFSSSFLSSFIIPIRDFIISYFAMLFFSYFAMLFLFLK